MRTKSLLLFVVFVSILINACKEEKPAPVAVKEPINISAADFALLAAKSVDKKGLNENSSRFIVNTGYNIIDEEADGAKVRHFPKIWEYESLKPILKEYALSVQLICGQGSHFQIENYEAFIKNKPWDKFHVGPKPKYIVEVGDEIFLVGWSLRLWRSREKMKNKG